MEFVFEHATMIAVIAVVVIILAILASGYVKAPPDTAFIISGFKKGPDNIIVDPLSDVREAKVLMLEAGIAGNKGSRRVYEESDLDLYTQMRKELNPDRVPMSILEISCVKLRLQLDPKKYGRKQCQTVTVRPNSCNINSKDPGVQLVIMETLKSTIQRLTAIVTNNCTRQMSWSLSATEKQSIWHFAH